MLHRPRIPFLDEPTIGLDPVGRKTAWEHVRQLFRDYGTTVFLTTHFMVDGSMPGWCSRRAQKK